jgi:uncharacterized protein YggE
MNKDLVRTYLACILITIGGLYVINQAHIAYPLEVTSSMRSSELSVTGEGKVDIVPDTATVTVGISVARAATVEAAQKQIDTINNQILAEMKQIGVPEADIKTSNYSINPNYVYDVQVQRVDGYNADASITIKTHKTDLVPQIVSKATTAGANQVNGVSYSIDDPAKFRSQARTKAIENAKAEAEKLARELGISLGKITNIVESSPGAPIPMYREAMALDTASAEKVLPEFEAGTQTITSTVTLFFEKR